MKNQKEKDLHAEFIMRVTKKDENENDIDYGMFGCEGCLVNALAAAMVDNPSIYQVIQEALGRAVMLKMQAANQNAHVNSLTKKSIKASINAKLN